MNKLEKKISSDEYLWRNILEMPYFRSILRAVEGSYYQNFDLSGRVLDIGSGDGHFAEVTFDRKIDVGLDPWMDFNAHHARYNGHSYLVRADGSEIPFENEFFDVIISNSVLEHIENVQEVLNDAGRVIKKSGLFLFCVPNLKAFKELSIAKFFEKFGFEKFADFYRNWFRKISLTYNADMPEVWQGRVEEAGFVIEEYWHYFSPRSLRALEWGHYFGLPSAIIHKFFGKWLLFSTKWNLFLTYKYCRKFIDNSPLENGTYTFYVLRKF